MRHISLTWSFRLSIAALVTFFIACQLYSLFWAREIYPVTRFGRAEDFHGFFTTVQAALDHGSLAFNGVFFKPPFFALAISPLMQLGFDRAADVYRTLLVMVVVGAIIAACWFKAREFWAAFALILVILCSYPFQFLFDRGNVDGFSLAFVLLAVIARQKRLPVLAALLFAVGLHIKSNVMVFLPLLVMHRTLAQTGWAALRVSSCIILLAALTPAWTLRWIPVAFERANWGTGLRENGSIFRAFVGVPYGDWIAWGLLGASSVLIVGGCLRRIVSKNPPLLLDLFLLCLPLCQAYPKQAYLYGYVFFPLLLLLYPTIISRPSARWADRYVGALGCVGVVLSCFPSGFTINAYNDAEWAFSIPSVGLVCMLTANAVLAWTATLVSSEEGSLERRQPSFAGRCGFAIFRGGSSMVVCLLCLASVYSVASFARAADSPVLWIPKTKASVDGVRIPETPLRVRKVTQGWGIIGVNRSSYGDAPLMINGESYDIGLGTHANSSIELLLPQGARYLSGRCGIDDNAGARAQGFVCFIVAGQRELFRSQVLLHSGASEPFKVSVSEQPVVILRVESATESNAWNLAAWVDLRVE